MSEKMILASASPRRIEMFRNNGIEPIVIPSQVDEVLPFEMSREEAVMYLALKKALWVEKKVYEGIIIAADTIVYSDKIIGKPIDRQDAIDILTCLNGTFHYVVTGVAILKAHSDRRNVLYQTTKVFFKEYSLHDIEEYVSSDEFKDKAGGYAIQGSWGKYVDHIEGDYHNVIGFPWSKVKQEFSNMGMEGLL